MTLKHCRDCGHEVSVDAKVCPNCGCVSPLHEKSHAAGWLLFVITLGVIAALVRSYVLHH